MERLFKYKKIVNLKKEDIIYKEGDKPEFLYIIKEGSVEVSYYI